MVNPQYLQEKWAPILDYEGLDPIKDPYRRQITATLLENQEREIREAAEFLGEAPTNFTASGPGAPGFSAAASAAGPTAGYDPVMISLIRRAMPNLMAYDVCGVQPMTGPTGLIFAMRSRLTGQSGRETFYDEVDSAFSGQNADLNLTNGFTNAAVGMGTTAQAGSNPSILDATPTNQRAYNVGQGMRTDDAEGLGDNTGEFNEMALTIERINVVAKSRALKAEYSLEMAQDLRAIHGLNAEVELSNMLSSEILTEINREVVRTIYKCAKPGAQANVATAGTFDLDVDANGRWSVEKFKGLLFQIERDANAIAQQTRRGKGNLIICSSDVASALAMAGVLDYTPALNANLSVDDTGNTFAGVLQNKFKVYIDPYAANVASNQYYVAGYKGANPYDAGLFYCPYVPLQMVRAVGENTFQPKIGFKTRYGMVANPFADGLGQGLGALTTNSNVYYRRVKVSNLM